MLTRQQPYKAAVQTYLPVQLNESSHYSAEVIEKNIKHFLILLNIKQYLNKKEKKGVSLPPRQ